MSQSQAFLDQTPLFKAVAHSDVQRISTAEQKIELSGADNCELDTSTTNNHCARD